MQVLQHGLFVYVVGIRRLLVLEQAGGLFSHWENDVESCMVADKPWLGTFGRIL
jgi:hypothetical protein